MKLFYFAFLLLLVHFSYSQETKVPVLEREISISSTNQTLEKVLNDISFQGDFVFSYSPEAINHLRNIVIEIDQKSVRYVLNQLFKDEDIEYKVKGKYVILKKKGEKTKPQDETRIFEGYVYDSQTGNRLNEASIYDKNLLASAITDKYGYFSMEVPANTPIKSLQVSKLGYSDTLLVSLDSAVRHKNIEISMKVDDSIQKKPLIDFEKFKPGWIVPEKLKINARNITEPVFRSVQFSLIPYLSTNRLLGGAAINDFSINATVGYVQGVRIFEAGGILNYVRTDVSFFHAAGIGNIVGGNLTGFQAAGIFNVVGDVKGFQAAGIFNHADLVWGTQAAGVYNLVKDSATVQLAGVFNMATKNVVQVSGVFNKSTASNVQIAGLLNLTDKAAFQLAGLYNQADTLKGSQIAGLLNSSHTESALQIAGALNYTNEDADVQISGLFNKAKEIKDFQLALINIADTSSGTSIGLFSFIKKGYHKLEISADETFPVNVSFRTGTYKFHTFLSAGTSSFNKVNFLWNIGYGLGASFGNPNKLLIDIDLTSSEVMYRNNFNGTYHWYKLYMGLDRKITKKMSIAFGVSYNALLSDSFQPDYNELNSRMPFYSLSNTNFTNGHNLKTWIGGKIGLRFF